LVAAELLERSDALVAVDHYVTVHLAFDRNHYDGDLLAPLSARDANKRRCRPGWCTRKCSQRRSSW
jgi:hypothetical protein